MSLVFVQLCVGTSQRGEDEEMGEQIVDGGMGKRTRSGEGVGGQNFGKEGNLIVFPFICIWKLSYGSCMATSPIKENQELIDDCVLFHMETDLSGLHVSAL